MNWRMLLLRPTKTVKTIPKEKLIVRKSFKLAFRGGEIWCEELDSLYDYTDLLRKKFNEDMKEMCRPSNSAFIAVNLNQTFADENLCNYLADAFAEIKRPLKRLAFAGISKKCRKWMGTAFNNHSIKFEYDFFEDFEKAKEWLIAGAK